MVCQTTAVSVALKRQPTLIREQPSFNWSSPPTTWQHSTLQNLLFPHVNHSTRLVSRDSVRKRMCLIFLPSVWTAAPLFTLSSVRMQEPPQHSENITFTKGEIPAGELIRTDTSRFGSEWENFVLLLSVWFVMSSWVIHMKWCGSCWMDFDSVWHVWAVSTSTTLLFTQIMFKSKIKHCDLPVLPRLVFPSGVLRRGAPMDQRGQHLPDSSWYPHRTKDSRFAQQEWDVNYLPPDPRDRGQHWGHPDPRYLAPFTPPPARPEWLHYNSQQYAYGYGWQEHQRSPSKWVHVHVWFKPLSSDFSFSPAKCLVCNTTQLKKKHKSVD